MPTTSNVTSGFIDLATFDELEKYMYGGKEATAYFFRATKKATWFTQVPVVLSRASGAPGFDTEWSVGISRAGDYLLSTWLRMTTPEIKMTEAFHLETNLRVRWTRNLAHNIIREASITFNDLVAARFDNYHLDFWTAFTVPAGKRNAYDNMIGNVDALNGPHGSEDSLGLTIPSRVLNLPLPFFFSRDTGVALPTAALPYNEMRINFQFRSIEDLLIVDDISKVDTTGVFSRQVAQDELAVVPLLKDVNVWANYAIVSNDERKSMACKKRDILIEQVQTAPRQTFNAISSPSYDIRFSHAIKVLFFGVRNISVKSQWSNYTCNSPIPSASSVNFTSPRMSDPISSVSLVYENTNRLSDMGADYFSLVNPWYHAPVVPDESGYHMYSYSLDFISLDPMGSTNYGKLTNVSITPVPSPNALLATNDANFPQSFEFLCTVVNNNIIRISGGALGFPVL
jgi:hypothetical protein